MTTPRFTGVAGALGALLLLLAVPLAIGGIWLITLGGSPAYAAIAVGLAVSGWLLARRSPLALVVYALLLAATLVWSVSEAGLDWWALAPRIGVPSLLALLLVLPWVRHSLSAADARAVTDRVTGRSWPAALLGVVIGGVAVVSVVSWLRQPHAIEGSLPPSQGALQALGDTAQGVPPGEWRAYGRTGYGQRYSPLSQIDPSNVDRLAVAWHYHTGDLRGRPGDPNETTDEVTPLKVGPRLFLCTPHQLVIALDATTGAERWRYDPKIEPGLALQHLTCRGLSYRAADEAVPDTGGPTGTTPGASPTSTAGGEPGAGPCRAKLFMPTADGRIVALDPATGAICTAFGGGTGWIDLWKGMPNRRPGAYYSTSPVVVTARLVVVGGTVLDNVSTHEQSGVIRAYDVHTGALVWNWDSGNPDVTTPLPPGEKYTVNSPNSWSVSSVDESLGLVYVPMGNQPPDQWGGHRSAAVERYSSSIVALDLATGRVRWAFQTVHHDLWDYDVPAQPSLVDLTIDGATVPALVQPTKQGEVFVLDRRTGIPLRPVTEVPVAQGAGHGDRTAATQPKSALSFEPRALTARDMWGVTIFDQLYCRIAFHGLRYDGRFTPPSTGGSLVYPGNFGVFNWGSIAVDPVRQVAFTTPVDLAFVSTLIPRRDDTALMVHDEPPAGALPALNENFGAPYAISLTPFVSPLGVPCQAPPWGSVAGVDLRSESIVWRHRNGTVRDLSPLPLPFRMGVPDLGGPILTAGGVAFLSGTLDYFVRAYDVTNGHQLWESRLPAGGQATPMTYLGGDGRQYLVVVAGGHGSTGTKAGDSVIAYALPGAP